jgi:hypothetical protein
VEFENLVRFNLRKSPVLCKEKTLRFEKCYHEGKEGKDDDIKGATHQPSSREWQWECERLRGL